ncbi:MAG: M48 family metallopeptidase [Paracoccaceae bacterium]|nr:M48 family metallopeptidase [Paracoccaceae bacterium]
MLRFSPILLALLYGLGMYWFSTMRLRKTLDDQSAELLDPSLQPVLNEMAKALEVDRVKVHLYEVDPINGLASPDGRIFITRGFYEKYKSRDVNAKEIAAVIAHELGHIALGHSRRRMIDFSSQNAIRAAMGMILGRFLPGIGNWVANIFANLLMAKLSRSDEYEADEYASALLIKSGIGTKPQITLFEKLEALTGQTGRMPAWLLSHPATEDRIKTIQKREQKWQGK